LDYVLVEVAGIEPASENLPLEFLRAHPSFSKLHAGFAPEGGIAPRYPVGIRLAPPGKEFGYPA